MESDDVLLFTRTIEGKCALDDGSPPRDSVSGAHALDGWS